jgi:hypothetical protein
VRSWDGREGDALDALLVLAFLEEPPPALSALEPEVPPLDDSEAPRAVPGNRSTRQDAASSRAA